MAAEGLGAIGINSVYLASQVFTFLILLWVLKKYLYRPILKKLAERALQTKKSLEASEAIIKKQENWEEKQEAEMKKIRSQAAKILAQAKQDADKEKSLLIEKAQKEAGQAAQNEYQKWQAKIKAQEKDLQNKITSLAIKATKKILFTYLGKKQQSLILKKQIKNLSDLKTQL